jgi:FMN phosphatase YigB (HAD superfamily)
MDPDFKNIKHWIFDLDNTLYNENDSGLGDQFVTNINIFMVEKMGLPAPRANELML